MEDKVSDSSESEDEYHDAESTETLFEAGIMKDTDGCNLDTDKIIEPNMDLEEVSSKILVYMRNNIINMEAPIALVEKKDGKMKVNEKAKDILLSCLAPVSVISIVGKYRTGKSYLMNRFFNCKMGFDLGSTIESTTKGIWMWIKPHPLHKNTALILLDFEGMGDIKNGDKEEDMGLFSLAVLLSKVMIYNVMRVIDNDMIHEIDFVSHLTEKIKICESEEEEDGETFMMHFPRLCFVLRDFDLELKVKDKKITPNEYLEHSLQCKKGFTSKIRDFNRPRECIQNYFPKRGCYTLCQPVQDAELLTSMESLPDSKLKPEFMLQVGELTQTILEFATPLSVGIKNSKITGRRLVNTYTSYINNGSIPCVESAISHLMKMEFEHACAKACEVYQEIFSILINSNKVASQKKMSDYHQKLQREALNTFEKLVFLEDPNNANQQIIDKLSILYAEYQRQNEHKSEQLCQKLIEECFITRCNGVLTNQYGGPGGHDMYKQETEKATQKYKDKRNKGPKALSVLNKYLREHGTEMQIIRCMDECLDEQEREMEAKKSELEDKVKTKDIELHSQRKIELEMKQKHEAIQSQLAKFQKEIIEKNIQQDKMHQDMKDHFHNMHKEQMKAIEQKFQETVENRRKQQHDHNILIEKMKQEQEQQSLKCEEETQKVMQERNQQRKLMKEQNVQYQIEIKRLKENIKFATDKAIAEKDKRKLGETHLQQIIEEIQRKLQKQEVEAEAQQQKQEMEIQNKIEKIQEHYKVQLKDNEDQITNLRYEETHQGVTDEKHKQTVIKEDELINFFDEIEGIPGHSYLQTKYKAVAKNHQELKTIQPMPHSKKFYMVSAAINIGQNFYGFSFKHGQHNIMMKKCYPSNIRISSLLVDLQDNCIAFGWDAEERYMKLEIADQDKYALYRLSDYWYTSEKLTKGSTITSTNGRISDAFKIFSIVLRCMKVELIESISSSIQEYMVRWVITVPSIWSDEAIQLFRASQKEDNIVISEDEAILSIVQHLDNSGYLIQPRGLFTLKPGLKYLVINAGDRTTDFTLMRVLVSEKVEKVHFSSGGPWGSEQVVKEFINIMIDIFGLHWMRKKHASWLKVVEELRLQINVRMTKESPSFSIQNMGPEYDYQILEQSKKKLADKGIFFRNGALLFTEEASIALFQPLMANIRKHLKSILDQVHGTLSTVILAGTLSSCRIIQDCIKESIPGYPSMVVPNEPGLAVIKGGVYYGHQISK